MCGHVGIAGDLAFKDEATIKRLLLLDYFRGTDSTGFAAVRNNNDVKIAKIASHPLDLFDMSRFKEALSGHNSKVFMGHNRAKTRGANSSYNAHPYEFGHIIGAHNGTLSPTSHRELEEKVGEKFEVDSQAIFACIEKHGIEETASLLQGAWALVWYDLSDGSLNFLRNKERSFWYAYQKDFKKVFWASEWPMIRSAIDLSTSGYDLYEEDKTGYQFWATEPDVWYRYEIEALKKGSTDRPKPYAKELKGKEPEKVVSSVGAPFPRNGGNPGTTSSGKIFPMQSGLQSGTPSTTTSLGTSDKKGKKEATILHLEADDESPLAGIIDKARFEDIAKYGCSYCQQSVEWTDVGVTIFDRDDIVLCKDCSGNKDNTSRVYTKDLTPFLP